MLNLWPFALIEPGQDQVRPFLSFSFGVGKQMKPAVDMFALRGPRDFKRIENFFQPAEIDRPRKFRGKICAPLLSDPFDFRPSSVPFQFREDRVRLLKELRKRGLRWKKSNFAQQFRDSNELFVFSPS